MPEGPTATSIINTIALVSVKYYALDRITLLKEQRFYGRVVHISDEAGITIAIEDQDDFILPADLSTWRPAPAGHYEDGRTGELSGCHKIT